MKAVLAFFTSTWVIQFIGVAALAVLIWFVGPLVAIAETEPLASEQSRIISIVVIFVIWVIFRLLMQLRAARRDKVLMTDLAAPMVPGKSAEELASEEEIAYLQKTFEEALQILRQTRAAGSRRPQFLYELPWYVIIGAPGSGKTTALVNSGLQFPLAERFGKSPIKGVSGTRNCDWWFTDQAVLLDTAGRYTTQDSHRAVDASAWQGFLGLLKKHRPRRPLNGVLVATSMSDLLQQTEEERLLGAKAVRQRIAELYQTLGVRCPVYMLFTKCDLVAGFNEFFADLGQDERAQVWGETFPAEGPGAPADVVDGFDGVFDELLERLDRRTYARIQDERDVQRRIAILEFPQQLELVKPAMMAFLRSAFGVSRYEAAVLLRGIYFTSGTQEGTPIDRVMGILAQAFRVNKQALPVYSGRGKSFFLTRLLRDVVFTEAELAGIDARVERRQRLAQIGLYSGVALLSVALISLWALSYGRNQQTLTKVAAAVDRYQSVEAPGTDWLSNMKALLPKLRSLREAGQAYDDAGWSARMGLYQGNKIGSAVDGVYQQLLQTRLLPLVKLRLEQRMAGAESADTTVLYELLRTYLMLGDPKRLEQGEARSAAEDLIVIDWQRHFTADPESLAELTVHLNHLLSLPPDPIQLNDALVAGVRARLTQVPQLVQIYSHLKKEKLLDHAHDLRMGDALGRGANEVFVALGGRSVADVTVPGFFTAKGYSEQFLKSALQALQESFEQNWVLGNEQTLSPAEIEGMRRDFEKLYLADYRDTWMGLLATLQLRRGQSINQTAELLGALSAKDSPLRALLQTIEQNTALSRVSAGVADDLAAKFGVKADAAKPDVRTQKVLDAALAAAGVGSSAQDPIRALERDFEGLNRLVRKNGDQPPPVDDLIGALKDLHAFALQVASGGAGKAIQAMKPGGGGGDAVSRAMGQIKDLPVPLKNALAPVASSVGKQTGAGAKAQLSAMLQTGVTVPCRTAFAGRYPFSRGSGQDATLADFGNFFAPNGVLDGFFKNNLQDLVDTSRPEWRQLPGDRPGLSLSADVLAQFQHANRIREAFFAAAAPIPKVLFELRPISLDAGVASFSLYLDGQEVHNRHGPEQISSLQWPGPQPAGGVRIVFRGLDGQENSTIKQGPWAWFRLLDEAALEPAGSPERFVVTFRLGASRATYELRAGSVYNPFHLPALSLFHCPEGL